MVQNPRSPRILVAIAALGDRLDQLILPAPHPDLQYVVFVQRPKGDPASPDRADTTYVPLESLGLSNSRNAALEITDTPYLVFSDDDILLDVAGLTALADWLDAHPTDDFAIGRRQTAAAGRPNRVRWFNSGHVCAPELILRPLRTQQAGIRFDPSFGVGATHPIGEDYIFLCDMLKAGLKGKSLPIVVGAHAAPSTGDNWNDPTIVKARAVVLARCFGWAAPGVRLAYAFKHRRHLGGWSPAVRFAVLAR